MPVSQRITKHRCLYKHKTNNTSTYSVAKPTSDAIPTIIMVYMVNFLTLIYMKSLANNFNRGCGGQLNDWELKSMHYMHLN